LFFEEAVLQIRLSILERHFPCFIVLTVVCLFFCLSVGQWVHLYVALSVVCCLFGCLFELISYALLYPTILKDNQNQHILKDNQH